MTTWNRCAQETTSETLNKDYSGVGGKLGSLGSMCTHSYIKKKKKKEGITNKGASQVAPW